ncbi:hypothetical protein WG66_007641 [Moniliophthora roreri]|nr:hypothetical protein WG66_007641 [Moniliophthora roreri]
MRQSATNELSIQRMSDGMWAARYRDTRFIPIGERLS